MQFFNYDPDDRGWYPYGMGTITATSVLPDARTRIYGFTGASFNDGTPTPPKGAPPGDCRSCAAAGDPVNLTTGIFTYDMTDLVVPDVMPLVLTRSYNSQDPYSRAFGTGMSHTFGMFEHSENWHSEADLYLPDGGKIHFTQISDPSLPTEQTVFEHATSPSAFYKARMTFWGDPISAANHGWNVTLPDGTVYVFPHAGAPLQAIRDRHGNEIRLTWESGLLRRITSPNGRWMSFTYGPGGRVSQVSDNIGRTVSYTYDANGNLLTVTDPEQHVTSYGWTANNQMVSVKPRNLYGTNTNLVTNEYTTVADAPTPVGWVKKQTHADGGVYQFAYTVSNGKSTRTDVTDPLGHVRRVMFNNAGYRMSDTRAFGLPEAHTTTADRPGTGNFVMTSADTLNSQLAKTVYVRNGFGNALSVTRCLAGQDPCTDTSPNALTTRYTYDPRFQDVATVTDPLHHTTTYAYDDVGNLRSVTDALQHSTAFEYNGQGQLTSTTDALQHTTRFDYIAGDLVATTDPLMQVTRRFTDSGGRLLSVTDPVGQTTRYTYDCNNQVLSITDALGAQTGFAYFPDGQLQTVTDANQHTTNYTYDVMGRMASRTDPLQRAETFSYDVHGNPRIWIDRKGQITTRNYDVLDRLHQIEYGDASTITYTYDERNRIRQLDDSSSSSSIVRTYDDFDRVLSETTPQGTVGYSYDGASRRTKLIRTGQPDIIYGYDNADRLTSVTRDTLTVVMTYDNANRRATLTLPNGIVTEYGYNDSNQVTTITYRYGQTTLGDLSYTYDSAGRRTVVGGTWARTGLPLAVTAATYDAANQLTAWGTEARQYDANGSLASDGLTSYVWDTRQRLSGRSGASSSAFAYDATGRRVSTTIDGASTSYLYDGANSLSKTQTGQSVQLVSGAMDEWFARIDSTGTKAFLRDALGSTVALTDSAGDVTDVYTYEPFGRSIAQGTTANAERFTGREQDDPESYYYRARYYRPTEGRFLSEDAIRLAPDASLYAYVGGDPVSLTDPTGHLQGPVRPPGLGIGAGLGVAGFAAFDIWIIQHDIDLLRQLCEAYGKRPLLARQTGPAAAPTPNAATR